MRILGMSAGRESSHHWSSRSLREDEENAAGCMGGILLHLFDFHRPTCNSPHSVTPPLLQPDSRKGLEAPRNSLEIDPSLASSTNLEAADHPDSRILCPGKFANKKSLPQMAKTPSVVARLMGLDGPLPDSEFSAQSIQRSGRRVSQVQRSDDLVGTMVVRSLPVTPRSSSARRSDAGDPRTSLQLAPNKENMIDAADFSLLTRSSSASLSSSKRRSSEDGNRSPRAREVVKQLKERVVRRRAAMADITNNYLSESSKKKNPKRSKTKGEEELNKQQSISLRKSNCPKSSSSQGASRNNCSSSQPPAKTSTSLESLLLKESEEKKKATKAKAAPASTKYSTEKCRKANCERFTQRTSCAGSSSAVSPSGRRDGKTPPPKARYRIVQVQPPSSCAESQLQTAVTTPLRPTASPEAVPPPQPGRPPQEPSSLPPLLPTSDASAARLYIAAILDCARILDDGGCSRLEPSVFHYMERFPFQPPGGGPLRHRSNRRLLFDHASEILCADVKLHLFPEAWLRKRMPQPATGRDRLLEKLSLEVSELRPARCETLADVDGLVELDERWRDEREPVVLEVERRILETLVEETLRMMTVMSMVEEFRRRRRMRN